MPDLVAATGGLFTVPQLVHEGNVGHHPQDLIVSTPPPLPGSLRTTSSSMLDPKATTSAAASGLFVLEI
jgi:hypothetical protein